MVFKRQVEGEISKAEDCKVAIYSCPLDITQTETKVTLADVQISHTASRHKKRQVFSKP